MPHATLPPRPLHSRASQVLIASLGEARFTVARERLKLVAQDDDDEALANELQTLLGDGKLALLPMLLR